MSVCVGTTNSELIEPVIGPLSTSPAVEVEVVTTSNIIIDTCSSSSAESKIELLGGKNVSKLVVASQTTPHVVSASNNNNQVLQKVVNSPLITVLNSTGPLTVVKSLCVTSGVSSSPQYTLVNTTALNSAGKPPTITVLNCGALTSPVTVVKALTTTQQPQQISADNKPLEANNVANAAPVMENRGHNVFVKNTCSDSVPSFTAASIINNINATTKPAAINGQRSKLKILSNIQITGPPQQNVLLNKPTIQQVQSAPRFNITGRQKIVGLNNAPLKYMQKSPNNVLKPISSPTVKSVPDKTSPKVVQHGVLQKASIKSLLPSTFLPAKSPQQSQQQQSVKTLSPQQKNGPGQVQRTGTGLRTIPPQRPSKIPNKTNYIGKHAVQAQKVKQSNMKIKNARTPNVYGGYHQHQQEQQQTSSENPMTFNQALTAQIIETLSNTTTPPLNSSRYDSLTSRYDNAFHCPDKQLQEGSSKIDDKKSGLDALSLICHAVLLDHNYNATLPSDSPPRCSPALINGPAQLNGIPSSPSAAAYNVLQKRRILTAPNSSSSLPTSSNVSLCASNSVPLLMVNTVQDDDAASDISDGSERKHDTEGEETDTAPEVEDVKNEDHYGDSVTRCICGYLHDDGYMVECDKCKVWQHVQCVVKNRQIPDEYLCEKCDPSKLVYRQKARAIQQQWIRERQLIEPKIRKEAKLKDAIRQQQQQKDLMSDSDSSDTERAVRNNNIAATTAKNRQTTTLGRRKCENKLTATKKDGKEPVQRRQRRKEKKFIKRRTKLELNKTTTPSAGAATIHQSHSDDENQDTWSAHLPQLRQWIEKYEDAVTNHYSPELRARISSIRVNNGAHVDSSSSSGVNYDDTVCKCRIHTQPLTEIKYLVSTEHLPTDTAIIELRGKYMLSTQHKNSGGSLATRQHTQKPGPFLFFYRLHKDNTEVCVDTRTYGNSARFIRRSCRPNAELRHSIEKGVLHLYVVSITEVEKNSELTIRHESHDLAAVGTTQIACACGKLEECTVNKTTIKKNGENQEIIIGRKRRGKRTISSSGPGNLLKVATAAASPPIKEQPNISENKPDLLLEPPAAEAVKEAPVVEEKVDIIEPADEVKIEIKQEEISLTDEKPAVIEEVKKEETVEKLEEDRKSPSIVTPVKVEKKEKSVKEEKFKSLILTAPPPPPVSTRRTSQHKVHNKDVDGAVKEESKEQQATKSSKKLNREERKLEAIIKAIEQMEKKDQKKLTHQARQAHRRESEPGPGKDEEKLDPPMKIKRRRRRGRARTTSTNAQTRRSRLNSTDSYLTSGDENLLSPNEGSAYLSKAAATATGKGEIIENKAAGLLLALSNGDSSEIKERKKSSAHQEHDSNSNSAYSSPDVPQLSSACLLVQAAVEPLESGFKFPKTKKGLMNEWLNKTPDLVQPASSISPSALVPHLNQMEDAGNKNLNALAQAASFCDSAMQQQQQQQRGGNAKKRWLRQAISEDQSCDSPLGRPDSPMISDAVAPPKKRKLPRESLLNDDSPPNTPTEDSPKQIDATRSSHEDGTTGEMLLLSGAEDEDSQSPSQAVESEDGELKEQGDLLEDQFDKNLNIQAGDSSQGNNIGRFMDPRLTGESVLFGNGEHLVGTVEKTLCILGFNNSTNKAGSSPTKRKLSITEYRQRKKLNTDKLDDGDMENDSQGNDDNNSSESFKNEQLVNKPRSRSSSTTSSCSSLDEPSLPDVIKAPAFNSEPTELERQREISNLRLKKAFGLPIDEESCKAPDMSLILNCDLDTKLKPSSTLTTTSSLLNDLSMSPTLRATYTPILPSPALEESVVNKSSCEDAVVQQKQQQDELVEEEEEEDEEEAEEVCTITEPMEIEDCLPARRKEENNSEIADPNLFYTPDDDDRASSMLIFEEAGEEAVSYVPPFNNPIYPNTNFGTYTSAIDDDSRYQSRNPSPPPNLDSTSFDTS